MHTLTYTYKKLTSAVSAFINTFVFRNVKINIFCVKPQHATQFIFNRNTSFLIVVLTRFLASVLRRSQNHTLNPHLPFHKQLPYNLKT